MKTEFGELSIERVRESLDQFGDLGETEFLRRYANGRGAKTTWIVRSGSYYPAKAIFAASLIPSLAPASFNTSDVYVFARDLDFAGTDLELVRFEEGLVASSRSALNDLDDLNGADLPVRHETLSSKFVRDPKVRSAVLRRARGTCEHCGKVGFKTAGGRNYLETHHIISLSNQGPDSLDNVIALCAEDHRRAHFGADWKSLEASFQAKLKVLRGQE